MKWYDIEMKMRCTKCGRQKEESEFRRDKGRTTGYHPWCKKCHSGCESQRRKDNPKPRTKVCIKCGLEKDRSEFSFKKKGKSKYRQLKVTCKKCTASLGRDRLIQKREAQRRYVENNNQLIRDKKRRTYTKKSAKFRELRDKLKSRAIKMMGGKCCMCGLIMSTENPSFCFDFHHRDPSNKIDNVGTLLHRAVRVVDRSQREKEFFEEVKKCDVFCAVCHRKRHYELGEVVK